MTHSNILSTNVILFISLVVALNFKLLIRYVTIKENLVSVKEKIAV